LLWLHLYTIVDHDLIEYLLCKLLLSSYLTLKVSEYQRSNQKPLIEGLTIQLPKEKEQKDT
jgi:hypothetical protein